MEDSPRPRPTEYLHDPIAKRPEVEKSILVRAQRHMLAEETEIQRYVRQQWEVALSAVRVALDCWNKVWPVEAGSLPIGDAELVESIARELGALYHALDSLSPTMLGHVMHEAMLGRMTHEDLDRTIGRDDGEWVRREAE